MPSKKVTRKNSGDKRAQTQQSRARITFPVPRVMKMLRTDRLNQRIGSLSAVFMAATLEYLAQELLEGAGNIAQDSRKTRITPRHIKLAIASDPELSKVITGVIHEGGIKPHIEPSLLNKGKKGDKSDVQGTQEI